MFSRRKDDEDPFAALRDGVSYQSTPTKLPDLGLGPQAGPTPTPTSVPTATSTPKPLGGSRRRRRFYLGGLGGLLGLRLLIFAIVIAGIVIPVIGVTSAVHSISVPSFTFGPSSTTANGPSPGAPAPQISYLRPAGVRTGLAHIAQVAPGARLSLLRLDATSLSATATLPNGTLKQIYFGPSVTSVTTGASSGERPIPISQIKPNVVGRLVAEMGRRFHVAPNRIDYMVLSSPPGLPAQWVVFSTAPSHPGFSATLSGANLTRLGG